MAPRMRNIAELPSFKNKIITAINIMPFCNAYKPDIIERIKHLNMYWYKYHTYSTDTNYCTFIGMVCSAIERILADNGVNAIYIDKAKDFIISQKR